MLIIGKVIKKTEERLSIVYWNIENTNNTSQTILTKCNSCNLDKKNDTEYIVSKHANKQHKVVEGIAKKKENIAELRIFLSAYSDQLEQYLRDNLYSQNKV